MTRLLYDPFGEESPARYNLELTDFPETPVLRILKRIVTGLSQGGLKMTAKGNLPAAFSQAVALNYYGKKVSGKEHVMGECRRNRIGERFIRCV
jgi:hypothetical protein